MKREKPVLVLVKRENAIFLLFAIHTKIFTTNSTCYYTNLITIQLQHEETIPRVAKDIDYPMAKT